MPRNPLLFTTQDSINSLIHYLSVNQQELDNIILQVPTSDARNQLTDCNIQLLTVIAALKQVKL